MLETCDPFPGQHLPITVKIKVFLLSMFSLTFSPCFFVTLFSFMLSLLVMPSLFWFLFFNYSPHPLYFLSWLQPPLLSLLFFLLCSTLYSYLLFFFSFIDIFLFHFLLTSTLFCSLFFLFTHSPFFPVSYSSFPPPSFSFLSIASIKRLASYSNNHSMHLCIDRCLFLVE